MSRTGDDSNYSKPESLFDFRHPDVTQYEIGKSIADYYVIKCGKENVKEAFGNLHKAVEMKPDPELMKLYRKIKAKSLSKEIDSFLKGLEAKGVEITEKNKGAIRMKFTSDYLLASQAPA